MNRPVYTFTKETKTRKQKIIDTTLTVIAIVVFGVPPVCAIIDIVLSSIPQ